ncbi:hypothetical protein ACFE04_016272 [Oxalis oulophora]
MPVFPRASRRPMTSLATTAVTNLLSANLDEFVTCAVGQLAGRWRKRSRIRGGAVRRRRSRRRRRRRLMRSRCQLAAGRAAGWDALEVLASFLQNAIHVHLQTKKKTEKGPLILASSGEISRAGVRGEAVSKGANGVGGYERRGALARMYALDHVWEFTAPTPERQKKKGFDEIYWNTFYLYVISDRLLCIQIIIFPLQPVVQIVFSHV